MGKVRKFGPKNRPTSTGEVKSFIKRANAEAISEYLDFIHQAGYRLGVRDAVTMLREKSKEEEEANDTESLQGESEPADDGESSSD